MEARNTGLAGAALCACALGLASPALSLDPNRAITQYAQAVWREDKDLANGGLLSLAQTPDRYLWIGTTEGLVRFDGARFTPIPIGVGREQGIPAVPRAATRPTRSSPARPTTASAPLS